MNRRSWVLLCSIATIGSLIATHPAWANDPTTADCIAASEASVKSGNEHHLRAARNQALICAAATCPADVRKECLRRVDEINPAIPTIIFGAKDAAGADLSAVKVTMDREVIAERLEGTALSIDPGEHTFVFETPGQPPLQKHFIIQEAQKDRREAIRFGVATSFPGGAPAPPPVSAAQAVPGPTPSAPPAGPTEAPSQPAPSWSTPKTLAIVSAGVGVVGLGLGTALGLSASSQWSKARNDCGSGCSPTAKAQSEKSDANTDANISNVGFAVGAAGLVAGAVLWFTAPKGAEGAPDRGRLQVVPVVGVSGGGWIVKGAF